MKTALSFDDVQILDGYSEVESRSEVDLSLGNKMELPVFAAAMDTVVTPEMAAVMLDHGAGVVHHRHDSQYQRIEKYKQTIERMNTDPEKGMHGIAIGADCDPKKTVGKLNALDYLDLIAIEVASANHKKVFEQIHKVNEIKNDDLDLMVGNISDANAFFHKDEKPYFSTAKGISDAIDFLKVSQGGGSVCLTRERTGIGKPTFQSVWDTSIMKNSFTTPDDDLHIVADGGLRKTGDIVKSIGAGASAVMLGNMLAGHSENFKGELRGMASKSAKKDANMDVKNIEGTEVAVDDKGPLKNTLQNIKENMQSGVSTAGFSDLESFRSKAKFIRVTRAGQVEATPHAK